MSFDRSDFESPALQELLSRYRLSLPDKRKEVEAVLSAALEGDAAALLALKSCAHKIAGSAASYGFENISLAAARVDDCILDGIGATPAPDFRMRLSLLARALIAAIAAAEPR